MTARRCAYNAYTAYMKNKEAYALPVGSKVNHAHYGVCTVEKVIVDFGTVILPDTRAGRLQLSHDSGMPTNTPLLEDNFKLLVQHFPQYA
jgi:hypothetical protein